MAMGSNFAIDRHHPLRSIYGKPPNPGETDAATGIRQFADHLRRGFSESKSVHGANGRI